MFTGILPKGTTTVLEKIAPLIRQWGFYLAGGSGLALQLGHRISEDLDLFSIKPFNSAKLYFTLQTKAATLEEILTEENTLLLIMDNVKLSFFYYPVPLLFEPLIFEGIEVADWQDIIAEKFKTIAQRGSKKDFYDLFETFYSSKLSIQDAVSIFRKRFENTGINFYHVLKSLTYFVTTQLLLFHTHFESTKNL
ncbi:nucleotidyl transferase AbiEii/AbiGii toxin family protein [bacterium]|nr:nucleotidyl transferase AbiEii/AbiGii toxin family protein [bacterium]MBU1754592.1 nucleotidyl transferase AbiEii/AbiGii toxin family protein [bacterium]